MGNMRKYLTKQMRAKIVGVAMVVIALIIWAILKMVKPFLADLGYKVFINTFNEDYLLLLIMGIILLAFIVWAIKHKLYFGLGYALAHSGMQRRLIRQLIDASIVTSREFDGRTKELPKITIQFDDRKTRTSGKVFVENTVQFSQKLQDINVAPALSSQRQSYVVETIYATLDNRFYVYEFVSTSVFEQPVFTTLSGYIDWAKSKSDDYSLRIDNRTTIPITHMGVSGVTGSGKSFLLQSLVEQVLSKSVNHQLFVIDPKRSDLYQQATRNLKPEQYAEKNGAIELLRTFHKLMQERMEMLDTFIAQNPNSTYKDAKLPALILLVDELGSLRESWKLLSKAELVAGDFILSAVAFLGRAIGGCLWSSSQVLSALTIPTSIRDQLIFKCVLGASDDTTYRVLFSPSVKIPNVKLSAGQGLFSYPGLSSPETPKYIAIPNCVFLKQRYWATERAQPAKLPQLGYGNNPSSEMIKKDEIALCGKEKTRKGCD